MAHNRARRALSWRPAGNVASVAILTSFFAFLAIWAWAPRPSIAAAITVETGNAIPRGSSAAASVGAAGNIVDQAFYSFTHSLNALLEERQVRFSPLKECLIMFNTAWVTTSTAPTAAAGVLGQPLGRAMVATASAHAIFALFKFTMAYGALTAGSDAVRRRSGPPTRKASNPTNPTNRPASGRRHIMFPLRRGSRRTAPAKSAENPAITDSTAQGVTIQVRRSAKMVPRIWLMGVTAVGGPGMGAVASIVTHHLGLISISAVWSSLTRGSVLGTFVSASLCFGGWGTWLAARWAVIQGMFGALFEVILSLEMLLTVSVVNSLIAARRRQGQRRPPGAASTRRGKKVEEDTQKDDIS